MNTTGNDISGQLAAISIVVGTLAVIVGAAQARVRNSLATAKPNRGPLELLVNGVLCGILCAVAVTTAVIAFPLAREAWNHYEYGQSAQVTNGLFLIVWILVPLLAVWPAALVVRVIQRKAYKA
jgi:NAD/NADP transhydrogenase beta subunit